MDVLAGGIDHSSGAARLGVERRFEERTEDCRVDAVPVEVGRADEELLDLLCHRRDLVLRRVLVESAVRVRERGKFGFEVLVSLVGRRVEDLEERQQLAAQVNSRRRRDELLENVLVEDVRVLGVEAEYETDAKLVKRLQCLGRIRLCILLQERVVERPDDLARLYRNLQFALGDLLHLGVDEEREAGVFLRQIRELDLLRRIERLGLVVNPNLVKVAGDDPAGLFVEGTVVIVELGLLERRHVVVSRLGRVELHATGLLLDEDSRRGNPCVEVLGSW